MVDRLLVAKCRQGSKEALRQIYEKYRDDLLILAIALSGDVYLAEDAVHDVFVAFAQNVRSFTLTGRALSRYVTKPTGYSPRKLTSSKPVASSLLVSVLPPALMRTANP